LKRLQIAVLGLALLGISERANATTITLTVGAGGALNDHILGEVIPPQKMDGPNGQLTRDLFMTNTLLDKPLGSYTGGGTVDDPYYYRSTTNYGPLPDAVLDGAVPKGPSFPEVGDYVSILLPLNSSFKYLVATWDGKNAGSQVWYLGGIAPGTTLLIPKNVNDFGTPPHLATSTKHYLTHYSLFNAVSVPEGVSTGPLVVIAILGIAMVRHRFGG
jgi:hypothetical protein